MNIGKISSILTPKKAQSIERMVTWVGPALLIPALRYPLDSPESRDELFVRDFTTYAVGAATFLGTMALAGAALKRAPLQMAEHVRKLTSFVAGFAAYILYCGIGAVKLSKKISKNKQRPALPAGKLSSGAFKPVIKKPVNLNYKISETTGHEIPHQSFNFASYTTLNRQKPSVD